MTQSRRRRSALLPTLVGLSVSAVLLWWALRGIRLADVVSHIRQAGPGPVLLTLVLATLMFPVRALRWRLMLHDVAGRPPDFRPTWHAIAIGYMANTLLPLRAGEVVRSYVLARLGRVSVSGALASVAVERVFDALTVVAMLALALVAGNVPAGLEVGGMPVAQLIRRIALAGLAVLGVAAVMFLRLRQMAQWLRRVRPESRLAGRVSGALEGVREHLAVFHTPARLPWVVLLSLAVWGLNAAALYVLFPAFGIEVDFAGALVLQAALVFGVALPSSPGFVGVYEAAIVFALGLYGVERDRALGYALVSHVLAFVPITVLGFVSLARTSLGWRQLRGGAGLALSAEA